MAKAQFVRKIICPNPDHRDVTPSCAVYADGSGYCFGCNQYFKELEEPVDAPIKPKEDLAQTLEQVKGLPIVSHRGLQFPYNNTGYYIVWPDATYYKLRRWTVFDHGDVADPSNKYISPVGHSKPWFTLLSKDNVKTCIVVEGEINALSIRETSIRADIISPGSATNFNDTYMRNNYDYFKKYDNIILLADCDNSGFKAATEFKSLLKNTVLDISIKLMEKDCNDILTHYGKETLEKELRDLDMYRRL